MTEGNIREEEIQKIVPSEDNSSQSRQESSEVIKLTHFTCAKAYQERYITDSEITVLRN